MVISKKVIQSLGQNPSLKEFHTALNQANLNKQEKISLNEIQLLLEIMWNDNSLESILLEAFTKFDKDNSGNIDEREFKQIMMNSGEKLDDDEFKSLMTLADTNRDGLISYKGKINSGVTQVDHNAPLCARGRHMAFWTFFILIFF